ncbi:D-alanyl-D-alanine carboxypeptidase [Burkholderia sp. GAS332]|nr:D-alanyl-D-alanine carboxypeptidase [Burkholderia sp. GAS332]
MRQHYSAQLNNTNDALDNARPETRPVLTSASAIIRLKPAPGLKGAELWGKDADMVLRPGSMTKLLTAHVGLKWLKKLWALNTQFECQARDAAGGSGNNLSVGDILDFENALANMGLPSSNVTTAVWARTIGKLILDHEGKKGDGRARFIAEMNATSVDLGMSNSRWGNVSGLDGGDNMSTARDLALLCEVADQCHPEISRIWSRATWTLVITGPNIRTVPIRHSANFIRDGRLDVLWGKTGTTRASGCSLLCEVNGPNGTRYYYVAFAASTNAARYADADAVFDVVREQLVAGFDWGRHSSADGGQWIKERGNEGTGDDFSGSPKGFGIMCTSAIAAHGAGE